MDKIAVYCGTRNHYPVMEVAAKSLMCHNRMDTVYFLIEDKWFPGWLPENVKCIDVSGQQWFSPDGANANSTWTYMANMRFAAGKIFPDIRRILYLDTDTLVLGDITELLEADVEGKYFAMVREDTNEAPIENIQLAVAAGMVVRARSVEARPAYPVRPYYNSGVMLMNLAELREKGMDDRLIHEIMTVKRQYPDQDAINILCRYGIAPMPQEYNVMPGLMPDFPQEKIRIKHYASDKPLWKSGLWQKYKRMTWEQVLSSMP